MSIICLLQIENGPNRKFRGIFSFALSAFVWTMAMQGDRVLADFSGTFAPANFTLSNSNANGVVISSGAPASISITGGNNGSGSAGTTSFTINAPTAGRTGFNWAYTTSDRDGPNFDRFGYIRNGTFVQVTNNSGGNSQSGVSMYSVAAGQSLGFRVQTTDNLFGSASATISSFLFSDTMYWKGNTNSSWGSGNWTLDSAGTIATFAPDSPMNVVFSSTGATNKNTVLGANYTIKSLTTTDSSAVTIGGGNTLTLSGSAGTGIDVQSGAGLFTTSANVTLAGSSNTFAVNNSAGAVISGAVGGSNGMIKSGTGTLTLSGANNYSGLTTVGGGKLTIAPTGSINGTSSISIGAAEFSYNSSTALTKNVSFSGTGGTLSGTGTITNAVTVSSGNTYSAGTVGDPGTQAFTNGITFQPGSIFSWDLDAPSADPGANSANTGSYDKVTGNGGGTGIFSLALGQGLFSDAFWDTNKTWTDIFSGSDPVFTLFSGGDGVSTVASNGAVFGQGQFSFSSGSLNWTSSSVVGPVGPVSPVPEPTSALVGILIGAGLLRRKRR